MCGGRVAPTEHRPPPLSSQEGLPGGWLGQACLPGVFAQSSGWPVQNDLSLSLLRSWAAAFSLSRWDFWRKLLDQGLARRTRGSRCCAQPAGSCCVACPAWAWSSPPCRAPFWAVLSPPTCRPRAGCELFVQFLVSSPASLTARDRAGDMQHLLIGFA